MSLLLSLDKSAQLGIHLVAEPVWRGSGVLRRGSGQKVVLSEGVHRLGASSQILREMVLVVVLRLGGGLLGGGRRVGWRRQKKVVLFQFVLAENRHGGFDAGEEGHLLPVEKQGSIVYNGSPTVLRIRSAIPMQIRVQKGKNDPKNWKKLRNFMFWSAGCSFWGLRLPL